MNSLNCAIAASITMLISSAAHAAPTWQYDTLSLTLDSRSSDAPALSLISQSATATVLSFDSLSDSTFRHASLDNLPGYRDTDWPFANHTHMFEWEDFSVSTAAGYRVTGVTVDVTVKGDLRPAAPNGEALNQFSLWVSLVDGNDVVNWNSGVFNNLNGTQATVGELDGVQGSDLDLRLDARLTTSALAALGYNALSNTYWFASESYANIGAENITLTFHTAPVPEPQTYLMLGAGLALVAGFARRQRNRRA